ncbi:MAG TPA: hypothetical protein VE053_13840 [Allosphingosinicella sp.]|nr:hypothetical protein [Allosphingosinicella sp.]
MLLSTVNVAIGADGAAELTFVVPDTGTGDHKQALVLIEYLGDEGDAAFEVSVAGVESNNISNLKTARVFAGSVSAEASEVAITIWGRAGSKFRVFTGWASHRLRDAVYSLPCSGCRMALKAALSAALATVGIPMPGDVVADILEAHLPVILVAIGGSEIGEFLRELMGEELYGRLLQLLGGFAAGFSEAMRHLDDIFRALCRELGLCN